MKQRRQPKKKLSEQAKRRIVARSKQGAYRPNLVLGLGTLGLGLVEIAAWFGERPKLVEAIAKLGKEGKADKTPTCVVPGCGRTVMTPHFLGMGRLCGDHQLPLGHRAIGSGRDNVEQEAIRRAAEPR